MIIYIVEEENGERRVYLNDSAATKRMNFLEETFGTAKLLRATVTEGEVIRTVPREVKA